MAIGAFMPMAHVTPWHPSQLFQNNEAGMVYDFRDPTTLFQNSDGTTPVTAGGHRIGRANDVSGNGNHISSLLNVERPVWVENGPLSHAYFDAEGETPQENIDNARALLNTSMSGFESAGPFSRTVVGSSRLEREDNSSWGGGFELWRSGLQPLHLWFPLRSAHLMPTLALAFAPMYRAGSSAVSLTGPDTPELAEWTVTVFLDERDGADSVAKFFVNGVQKGGDIGYVESTSSSENMPTFTLGADYFYEGIAGTYPFWGRWSRLIIIDRELTERELELSQQWCDPRGTVAPSEMTDANWRQSSGGEPDEPAGAFNTAGMHPDIVRHPGHVTMLGETGYGPAFLTQQVLPWIPGNTYRITAIVRAAAPIDYFSATVTRLDEDFVVLDLDDPSWTAPLAGTGDWETLVCEYTLPSLPSTSTTQFRIGARTLLTADPYFDLDIKAILVESIS